MKTNVLILGSGGREHAFAWKIAQSPKLGKLFIAPGNAGTMLCGENVALDILDFKAIQNFVLENAIDLVVVGPEEPLVKGIRDFFEAEPALQQVRIVGPRKAGAQLEGSKDFAKKFMARHGIPTAAYKSFSQKELEEGLRFLEQMPGPYVLKASGLAAGKGVVILEQLEDAKLELREMLSGKFGAAGDTVVVEAFLKGVECSVFVLTDGRDYFILPEAKDHKRIGEGDTGLNTGGMGAFSPVPFCDSEFMTKVRERIIAPTINGLQSEGIPYTGFIFFGLINVDGNPFVIEYNCRMGDPETEVVLPRLENDLLDVFDALFSGKLAEISPQFSKQATATVVVVSGGYPEAYEKGKVIHGLDKVDAGLVFHAGTQIRDGAIVTSGGRVLAFTGKEDRLEQAVSIAYVQIDQICYEGIYYRKDIAR
ncbi:MAG: phosphoribosylamine--glycine ligase [Bacteroidia bacterium]|jgi:phosphoribosylamine--glycine ligase